MTPTRRRGDALTAAIRHATRVELVERGYAQVSFAGVAQRVGTSRPVLHRRYPTRAHLVVDALLDEQFAPDSPPPGSDLREDLLALLTAVAAQYERIGLDTYRMLTAEADDAINDRFTERTRDLVTALILPTLRRAQERGELGPTDLSPRVTLLPVTLLRQELLTSSGPTSRETLTEIADQIVLPLWRTASGEDTT